MKNIAVFFGGQSVEHQVSIITGTLTVNSLDSQKYNGIPIYCSQDGLWFTGEQLRDIDSYKNLDFSKLKRVTLKAGENVLYQIIGKKLKAICNIALAINCMHGERGEDGCLFGYLSMCKIPLASPPLFASATSISKTNSKIFLNGLHIKTLPYITIDRLSDCSLVEKALGYPLIVKPDCGGSSIGVGCAYNSKQLYQSVSYALKFGEKVIVEPLIKDFTEINCAVYSVGGSMFASPCERPIKRSDFLSFGDKYCSGEREFPANIPENISKRIQSLSKRVYQGLGCKGIIRIDFMLIEDKIYLNEINTVPGSLAYYLFCNTLKEYSALLTQLIVEGESLFAKSQTYQTQFSSGILNVEGCKSSKCLKNK